MAAPGRPTKLTPAVQALIVQALEAGNVLDTAGPYAGIDKATLYRWLKAGRKAKSGIHREFCDAVEKAVARAEVRDVALIAKAAETQWQAGAWRLERRFPERWGRASDQAAARLAPLERERLEAEIELLKARRRAVEAGIGDAAERELEIVLRDFTAPPAAPPAT